MTTTTPTSKKIIQRAIIFLEPGYNQYGSELIKELNYSCKKSGLSVIKTICANYSADCSAFHQLIEGVTSWQQKPITVIVNKEILDSPIDLLTCAVLGTLSAAKLIEICTYEMAWPGIRLQFLSEAENSFLYLSTTSFTELINFDKQ